MKKVDSTGSPRRPTSRDSGFTFIELLLAVGIIGLMATAGVNIFLRSLRGSSQIELRRTLDDRARLILDGMGRFFHEGRVVSLDGQTRSTCLAVGSITGDTLVVKSLDDLETTLSVSNGLLSSASATTTTVVINPESVTLEHWTGLAYYFNWVCSSGTPDRLQMLFKAVSASPEGEANLSNDYDLTVIMRNSGQ